MSIAEFFSCAQKPQRYDEENLKMCTKLFLPKTFLYLIFLCVAPTDNISKLSWFSEQTNITMSKIESPQLFQFSLINTWRPSMQQAYGWKNYERIDGCTSHVSIPLDISIVTPLVPFYENTDMVNQIRSVIPKVCPLRESAFIHFSTDIIVLESATPGILYSLYETNARYVRDQYLLSYTNLTRSKAMVNDVQKQVEKEVKQRQTAHWFMGSKVYDIFTPITLFTEIQFYGWSFKRYQKYIKIFENDQDSMGYNRFIVRSKWKRQKVSLRFDVHDERVVKHRDFIRIWILHMLDVMELKLERQSYICTTDKGLEYYSLDTHVLSNPIFLNNFPAYGCLTVVTFLILFSYVKVK